MKKTLSLLLCLAMILSMFTLIGTAVSAETSGDFEYSVLDNGTVSIIEYTGSATDLTVPSELGGYTVTAIGSWAFANCTSLESITIPNTVTTIGSDAFYNTGYYNNRSNWEDNVLYIGEYLIVGNYYYYDEIADKEYTYEVSGNYTVKSGTKYIAEYAFYNCKQLESITLPNSVISINAFAFLYCKLLENVTLSENLTSIGNCAFSGCMLMNNIILPDSLASIGEGAFSDCRLLESVSIPGKVTEIKTETFIRCSLLESVTISSGVTSIGNKAFFNCKSLESVTLPEGLKSIGTSAFDWCKRITTVTIPKSVTSIGEKAFGYDIGQKVKNFTINGYSTSVAKTYATENGITFISLDKVESPKSATPELNLTAGKKMFKVKYNAVANADGFQIRYRIKGKWTVKTFNTKKSVTKTIKKLKSGKKYKVQIRSFTAGKAYYSNWSKIKTVKVK